MREYEEYEDYVDKDTYEYCIEMCYHEFLCDFNNECLDLECYYECIKPKKTSVSQINF